MVLLDSALGVIEGWIECQIDADTHAKQCRCRIGVWSPVRGYDDSSVTALFFAEGGATQSFIGPPPVIASTTGEFAEHGAAPTRQKGCLIGRELIGRTARAARAKVPRSDPRETTSWRALRWSEVCFTSSNEAPVALTGGEHSQTKIIDR